jgi:hypothetical protein
MVKGISLNIKAAVPTHTAPGSGVLVHPKPAG